MSHKEPRERKKDGQLAAKQWASQATNQQQIDLAGCNFEYGETLDSLIQDGFDVPPSSCRDFSWGFYKKIKGRVHSKMNK